MFHLFDDNEDEFTQMLGNMALYKIPMNNKDMDEAMPAFGCLVIVILAIVGILWLVGFIPAG